jgi:hypothetical protein
VVLGFELRASHLLGNHSTTWAMPSPHNPTNFCSLLLSPLSVVWAFSTPQIFVSSHPFLTSSSQAITTTSEKTEAILWGHLVSKPNVQPSSPTLHLFHLRPVLQVSFLLPSRRLMLLILPTFSWTSTLAHVSLLFPRVFNHAQPSIFFLWLGTFHNQMLLLFLTFYSASAHWFVQLDISSMGMF